METRMRSLTKAASWQGLGLVTMSALGYLFTGSLTSGGILAVTSGGVGFCVYLLHERLWARVQWGWDPAGDDRDDGRRAERVHPQEIGEGEFTCAVGFRFNLAGAR